MPQTLLLNWVYFRPVGHAVEALKAAKGFHAANPDLEIHVVLNARMPVELAEACPWITKAYGIDIADVAVHGTDAASLRRVPAGWDYVVTDERTVHLNNPDIYSPELRAFHEVADAYFQARRWKGLRFQEGAPPYVRDAKIRLHLPPHAQHAAPLLPHDGPAFCILPAGSSDEPIYPSLAWWTRLLHALHDAFPGGRFYVTGVSASHAGRTATPAFSRDDLDGLFAACPFAVDAYDVGLWNQLALIERCDVFIAPHTGFAFLAPCLGTPWLAVSGGRWPEYLFNQTPFYCVLPDCPYYPCYFNMKPACTDRLDREHRVLCMTDQALDAKLPDLVAGARKLLDPAFTYEKAVAVYRQRIRACGAARDRFFSFDGAISLAEG